MENNNTKEIVEKIGNAMIGDRQLLTDLNRFHELTTQPESSISPVLAQNIEFAFGECFACNKTGLFLTGLATSNADNEGLLFEIECFIKNMSSAKKELERLWAENNIECLLEENELERLWADNDDKGRKS